jgi:hypothetical protein
MPPAVTDDMAAAKIDLLPVAGEVQPRCSCPDWADPCKHSAAVCYLVADTLDVDPFQLFGLRGRDRESLLAGLRALRAAAIGAAAAGHGAADAGRFHSGADADTSWGTDAGLNARDAWHRWAAGQAGEHRHGGSQLLRPVPAVPLPPSKPGRPTVLAVDPPARSGLTAVALDALATDAVQRALQLAHGERSTGLELGHGEDVARRASRALGAGDGDISGLARAAGLPVRALFRQALAWRDGGSEGLAVLLEDCDPPGDRVASGRELLGPAATIRRNRVTLGDRQLRLGKDGRWYPYRRAGPRGTSWDPDGGPLEPPAAL